MSELRIGAGCDLERISLADLGRSSRRFPGLLGLFRTEVPLSFYTATETGVTVSCVCGRKAEVERYGLTECGCGRWFVATQASVRGWRPGSE